MHIQLYQAILIYMVLGTRLGGCLTTSEYTSTFLVKLCSSWFRYPFPFYGNNSGVPNHQWVRYLSNYFFIQKTEETDKRKKKVDQDTRKVSTSKRTGIIISLCECCLSIQFNGTVYTFGFGSDHDASMLEAISTQGGGVYYYIDSNEKVRDTL